MANKSIHAGNVEANTIAPTEFERFYAENVMVPHSVFMTGKSTHAEIVEEQEFVFTKNGDHNANNAKKPSRTPKISHRLYMESIWANTRTVY